MTYNRAKKPHRVAVLLSEERYQLCRELMQGQLEDNVSAFFSGLLVFRRDCLAEHSKRSVGRPKNSDDEIPPFVMPDRPDTLSFTEEEKKKIAELTERNRRVAQAAKKGE